MEILSLDEIEEQERIWSTFSHIAHERSEKWFREIKDWYVKNIDQKIKDRAEKYGQLRQARKPFKERESLIDDVFILEEMRAESQKRNFREYLNPEDMPEIKRKGLKKFYQDIFLFI